MTTSKNTVLLLLCSLTMLVCGCSDDDPSIPDPDPGVQPSVQLTLTSETIGVGEESILSIILDDIDDSVFALSLRIGYDPAVVVVDEDTGFLIGDFMSADALALFQIQGRVLYLSLTDIGGTSKALKSGSIGTVTVEGMNADQCDFTIAVEDFRFIDAAGGDVLVTDLQVSGVS